MKILERYLNREILLTSLVVLLVLVLILSGNALLRIMDDVVNGELPREYVASLLGVTIILQLVILTPFSFFLGVILSFGRLYQDAEMAAITSGGVGLLRLYRKLLWLLLPLFLILLWLGLSVNAWAITQEEKIWEDARKRVEVSSLIAGSFNRSSKHDSVIFFESYGVEQDGRQILQKPFIHFKRGEETFVQSAVAAQKHIDAETGNVFMRYHDGYIQNKNTDRFSTITFAEHHMLLKEKVYPVKQATNIQSLSFLDVLQSTDRIAIIEMQSRLSVPLGGLLLILLAVPFSKIAPRKGRYSRMTLAVLTFFLYMYIQNVLMSTVSNGHMPLVPGMFVLHLVLLACILVYLIKEECFRRRNSNIINSSNHDKSLYG